MIIRNAAIKDAPALAELGRITFLESHGHSAPDRDISTYVQEKYTVAAIAAILTDPANHVHLLETETDLVGYSVVQYNCPAPESAQQALTKLDRFYLLAAYHNQQLGRRLFNYVLNGSKAAGQEGMWLYTWVENHRAIRFYEKQGFVIAGHHDFRLSPTHSNPNHLMMLVY